MRKEGSGLTLYSLMELRMTEYKPCECSGPGFCSRYNREMSEDLHLLCKSREDYRKKFDSHLTEQDQLAVTKLKEEKKTIKERVEEIDPSEDPMLDENKKTDHDLKNVFTEEMRNVGINEDNVETHSEGLGDTISKVLKKIGITEERFEKLSGAGGCGCSGRKTFLNKVFPYRNKEGK